MAAITAESLNPEEIGSSRGQILDLSVVFLQFKPNVGRFIQIIVLAGTKRLTNITSEPQIRVESLHVSFKIHLELNIS